MTKYLHPCFISFLLIVPLLGCGRSEDTDVVTQGLSESSIAIPMAEPSVTVASGFQYDEDESWTKVTEDNAEGKHRQSALRVLKAELQIGVVFLGDHLRIYNVSRGWLPMTLTLIDEEEKPLESFRLDLPPSGVIRTVMPQIASDQVANLRLTRPHIVTEENGPKPILLDRRIGTPASEFTTESVAQLGFVTVEKHAANDEDAGDALIAGYTRGEVEREVVQRALAADGDIQIATTKTESGVASQTFHNPTTSWKSIVLADRHSAFVSHGGNDGEPPSETWWVSTISDVLPRSE